MSNSIRVENTFFYVATIRMEILYQKGRKKPKCDSLILSIVVYAVF